MTTILKKTTGLVDVLREFLVPLAEKIEVAFVFGSVARGTENLGRDIDVLVIGDVSFSEVITAFYPAQTQLGREINPKIYTKVQWKKCIMEKNAFAQEMLNNPQLLIIGDLNDIR